MNTFTLRLLATLLFTSPAFAASSVDLTVKGLITPSACTLDLPGVVDYGKISAKDLNLDKRTPLELKTISLTISCEAQTLFAINPVDNRPESGGYYSYGLGLINGSERLGSYDLTFHSPVADIPSKMLNFREGRWMWIDDDEAVIPNSLVALGEFQTDVGYLPHPLQNASLDITVYAAISAANTLTLTDEVAIDGSTTLELKYL
ncbi:DUF1120 domain-containing protein [Pseudomonas fluorescens]|uniref:DUF1120 domain-containing protein n=1 Tax=Pseudomonas fluorescens TaxID=294 RepID=UPI001BE82870|nr:DUF1120 domain-containing protein [Pseudomonas fluorescens]MBT2372109.1 DUF1120 domain-containing protein [Pseudomonas fluorescens]